MNATVSSRTFTHTVVIAIGGRVDDAGSRLLRHELVNAMKQRPPRRIVVDLARATSLEPTAIGALLAAHDTAPSLHLTLIIRNANKGIAADLADQGLRAQPRRSAPPS